MHGRGLAIQRPILPIHYVIRVWALLPIRVRALIRIWAKQGYPAIPIWAARTRMGQEYCPYAYGIAHTRMGKIHVWDGTTAMYQ